MSEKIYVWLLKLFPASFRKAYEEDALQLYRDRARDERGLFSGLRLWLDLLTDLAIAIPLWHRTSSATLLPSPTLPNSVGIPSFYLTERETLSLSSLFYGGVAALLVYNCVFILAGHGGNRIFAPPDAPQQSHRHSANDSAQSTPSSSASVVPSSSRPRKLYRPLPEASFWVVVAENGEQSTVTLVATVLATDSGPIPTGSICIFDGSEPLYMGKLDNGIITVQKQLPHIENHSLSAVYYGDDHYGLVMVGPERANVSPEEKKMFGPENGLSPHTVGDLNRENPFRIF